MRALTELFTTDVGLLSIGAIDFGMIVDGSIVMVENIFRTTVERHERGEPFDLVTLVRGAAREVARPIVFAIAIIVASYLPIFTLQRVEGRLFRPMAFTVGFALLGALLLAITLVPVIASYVFKRPLKEAKNPLLELVRRGYLPAVGRMLARPKLVFLISGALLLLDAVLYANIGSEFLPHLNEGALWVRASMPGNISLREAEQLVDGHHDRGKHVRGIREILRGFPEVGTMAVQLGRPDDDTDPTGFFNAEFLLVLKDRAQWRERFDGDRERLEDAMSKELGAIPGVSFGFSQPISDNVEEALTGVKGQLAIKVVGDNLDALDDLGSRIAQELAGVPGVRDLGVFREIGQSNLHVEIDRRRSERLGLSVQDVEAVIEAGVGGRAVTQIVEGERTHDGTVEPLKPGVSLLIKRVSCPIIPVGIAGCFGAWSRHMKWPKPSPLLLPPTDSTIAVSVGEPIDPARYEKMKRDAMMDDLHAALKAQHAAAERLCRK